LSTHGTLVLIFGGGGGGEGCGRQDSGCADIAGGGEWEPFTSSVEDDDGDDFDVTNSDEEDVARVATAPGALASGAGASNLEEEDNVHEGDDMDLKAPKGDMWLELRRHSVLQKVRAHVQIPPDRPFDKEDIKWVKKTNYSGRGKKEVLHAIIPWNRLEDFVKEESTCWDFPSAFLRKPWRMVQSGSRSRINTCTRSIYGESTHRI
jgi:hypothetical protein